jgi:hypothetical protein
MVPPLTIIKAFAEVPFTVKSLASRVPGSTARVRLTEKSVGGVKTVIPQSGLLTEQPAEVGVGVAVAVVVGVAVAVAVGVSPAAAGWEALVGALVRKKVSSAPLTIEQATVEQTTRAGNARK